MRYRLLVAVALVMICAVGCGSNNEASSANEASAVEASEITPADEAGSAEQASTPNEAATIANSSASSEDASALGSSNEEKDKADGAASKDVSAEAGSLKSDDKQESEDKKAESDSGAEKTTAEAPAEEKKEAPAEEKKEEPVEEKKEEQAKEAPAATGVVIDEEEFRRGVMMGPKKGTIVNDDFATGVTNSLISQLNGMGAVQTTDPAPLIFRSKPFRFETSPEEAASAMINDVMPMFGFEMAGKNYFVASVQKFDNGYVVTVGWTRWN